MGHAKVLLPLKAPEEQLLAARNCFASQRHRAWHRTAGCSPAWDRPFHDESLDALGLSRASRQRQWKIYRTACKNTSPHMSPSITETNEAGLKSMTTGTTRSSADCNCSWAARAGVSGALEVMGGDAFAPNNTSLLPYSITPRCLRPDGLCGYVTCSANKKSGKNFRVRKLSRMFNDWSTSGHARLDLRPSRKSRGYIEEQLRRSGWQVTRQAFTATILPRGKVQFVNLIAQISRPRERGAFVFVVLALRYENVRRHKIRLELTMVAQAQGLFWN